MMERVRRRLAWVPVALVVAAAAGSLARTAVVARDRSAAVAQQASPSPSPTTDGREATDRGTDPGRNLQPYDPKPLDVVRAPEKLVGLDERRAIRLVAGAVELVEGAEVLRRIPFDTSGSVPFDRIAEVVGDPEWVEEVGEGEFLLKAAFAQAPGTDVLFGGEGVRTLRLATRPDVFVGGVGASARFQDVLVTSWDEGSTSPERDPETARPFVLYENGSTLDIVRSEIGYLGYDRSMAYGVSWRLASTGSLVDSEIHHNFFGVYTFEAHDIEFRENVFRDNAFYGLDPHDFSTGLLVVGNEAFGNGSHGIIFSRGVVDSVVRDNHAHDNGGNGIVMDFESDRNLVERNRVDQNEGDGIVVLGSSDVTVRDNLIRGNRVGVRLNHQGTGSVVGGNRILANEVGIQVYDGAHDVLLESNRIEGSGDTGIVLEEAGATSRGDLVVGSSVGVEIRAPAALEGTRARDVGTGVRVTERGIATMTGVDLQAGELGVEVEGGGIARLERSNVSAPEPLDGSLRSGLENRFSRPLGALPWFAIAGVSFVSLAFVLQLMHRARNRGTRRRPSVPRSVVNVR